MKSTVFQLVREYFQTLRQYKNGGDAAKNNADYLHIHQIEKQLLHYFGLPNSVKYRTLLLNLSKKWGESKNSLPLFYYELSLAAEDYLSQQSQTARQLLATAKTDGADPFDLLPEMSVSPNSYTLYIYHEILLKEKDSDEAILQEFQTLNQLNCLTSIYLLCFDEIYFQNPIFAELSAAGLKYIAPYLKWFHTRKKLQFT